MDALGARGIPFAVAILLVPISLGWMIFGDAVTQDGPAHLAAAKIANEWIRQSLGRLPADSVSAAYRLQFEPLPNWGGQALGMALVAVLPIHLAEIGMNLAGLWLPALSLAWFVETARKSRLEGRKETTGQLRETFVIAFWIATLAANALWTFGFASFLIGTAMAWAFLGRLIDFGESGGPIRWLFLTTLWCLTFLCHLVAFAIGGIVAVCLLTFHPHWTIARRAAMTASIACAIPLWFRYRQLTGDSRLEPIWEHLRGSELLHAKNWIRQFGWIDPLSLHSKNWHPLAETGGFVAMVCQPVLWFAVASTVILWLAFGRFIADLRHEPLTPDCANAPHAGESEMAHSLGNRSAVVRRIAKRSIDQLSQRRLPECTGFLAAAAILAGLGTFGPDSLGARQGHYLPQRFWLAALCMVPLILASARIRVPTLAAVFVVIAWGLQNVAAIDFARRSHELTQPLRELRSEIHPGDRLLALIDATAWPYRANPRLHADSTLVMGADDVVSWNLYEAAQPYFPLRFRAERQAEDAIRLEAFSLAVAPDHPNGGQAKFQEFSNIAEERADVVVIWMNRSSVRRSRIEASLRDSGAWVEGSSNQETSSFRRSIEVR